MRKCALIKERRSVPPISDSKDGLWVSGRGRGGSAKSGRKRARSLNCVPDDISPIFWTFLQRQPHSSLTCCKSSIYWQLLRYIGNGSYDGQFYPRSETKSNLILDYEHNLELTENHWSLVNVMLAAYYSNESVANFACGLFCDDLSIVMHMIQHK